MYLRLLLLDNDLKRRRKQNEKLALNLQSMPMLKDYWLLKYFRAYCRCCRTLCDSYNYSIIIIDVLLCVVEVLI